MQINNTQRVDTTLMRSYKCKRQHIEIEQKSVSVTNDDSLKLSDHCVEFEV